MNYQLLWLLFAVSSMMSFQTVFAQATIPTDRKSVPDETYLVMKPILSEAVIEDGYVKIPFSVTNNYRVNVFIEDHKGQVDGLMTLNESKQKIFIEAFENRGFGFGGSGPVATRIVLRPGESRIFKSVDQLRYLELMAANGKDIFAGITGYLAGTNQKFYSYSDSFPVPPNLSKPPWVDLGENGYFSVDPDLKKTELSYYGNIIIPVKITNITKQPYIAAVDSVAFCMASKNPKAAIPSPWETIKVSGPVLKPGGYGLSTGRCYITVSYLKSQGYKKGDRIVAAVGGRVLNTDQIFECYSAPFELPSLKDANLPK